MDKTKAVAAVSSAIVIALAGGAVGYHISKPDVVTETVIQNVTKEVPVEVIKEVTVEVPVEVVREVNITPEEVPMLLDLMIEQDGDVEFLIDDLDDEDVDELILRIGYADDLQLVLENELEKELFDELDKYNASGVILDEDDMEDLDIEEINFTEVDFEDQEATIRVEVEFEHDDDDYEAVVDVEFEGLDIEDIDIVSVTKV